MQMNRRFISILCLILLLAVAAVINAIAPRPTPPSERDAFFNHETAERFEQSIDPSQRQYIVHLNARSFLPEPVNETESLLRTLAASSVDPNGRRAVYLQFFQHPNDSQRAQLKVAGIELSAYVNDYAWLARGTSAAFESIAPWPNVRGISAIKPEDKLHPQVYARNVPNHAKRGTRAELTLLALPGTSILDLQSEIQSLPAFASGNAQLTGHTPCVLGPRYNVTIDVAQAGELAAASQITFVEYTPAPRKLRDATTDLAHNVAAVRDSGPNLTGSGITVAIREFSTPTSHVDFISRFTQIQPPSSTDPADISHVTGTCGQIASSGVNNPSAKGIAPAVNLRQYIDDGSALDEGPSDIITAGTDGARMSSHSYGPIVSAWGDYQTTSADWDGAISANNVLPMFAGNEETGGLFKHIDYMVGMKNSVCVGASKSARAGNPGLTPPVAGTNGLASFSEFGPMNDGRIKPDLVAYGSSVTLDSGTNSTQVSSGTSFSTPAVTGATALILQRYKSNFGVEPSAALVKALLCESATDLGNAGPDASYGFGLLNVQEAIRLIDLRTSASVSPFREGTLSQGQSSTFTVTVPASTPYLRVTLNWMDLAGNPAAAKALVNDLDLTVTTPTSTVIFPFSLSTSSPSAVATATAANRVDPIEQVHIATPTAGTYTIKVNAFSIPSGSQAFALATNLALNAVTAAATTTTSSNVTTPFSASAQNISLSATVTSTSTVNEGTVTFQVKSGSTNVGTAVTVPVANGAASTTTYSIPPGQASGTYSISATFNATTNFTTSADTMHNLTISPPATVTSASNASAIFNAAAQNVTLNATVTSAGGTVNEGNVSFQIMSGSTNVGTAVGAAVSNGAASASYALPPGQAAGMYSIVASYNGTANFQASSDNMKSLTISSAAAPATITTAANASATFNASTQNVTLTATVTATTGVVNEGNVSFQIKSGTTNVGAAVSASVANGAASASYALPAGQATETYSIVASYNGTANFQASSDTKSLTVTSASAPATTTVAANATTPFNASDRNVTLSATVTSPAVTLGEGTVTFQVKNAATNIGSAITVPVSNGVASGPYVVLGGLATGTYTIVASYSGSANFKASSDSTHTLTVTPPLPATVTTAANAMIVASAVAQNVQLSATVTSTAGVIGEGTVSFQLKNGSSNVGLAITGAVANGSATATYALPAATAAGTYTIVATYSGSTNFLTSSDSTHMLTVLAAPPAPPTFASGPTATPSPADLKQNVNFTAAASSVLTVTYAWDFGDSTSAAGASVTHAYAVAGPYTVTVTATDSANQTGKGTVTLVVNPATTGTAVLPGEIDSDGDGFSDALEKAAGTNPLNAADSPSAGAAPVKTTLTLTQTTVSKAKKLTIKGDLAIPKGFVVNGKKAVVDIGGYAQSFTLNSRGSGKAGAKGKDTFAVTIKLTKKEVLAQSAKFTVTLNDVPSTVTPNAPVQVLLDTIFYAK